MKINKIVLITNNFDGAMLQMTGELLKDLTLMGFDAVAYVPNENNLTISKDYRGKVKTYNFGNNKMYRKINGLFPYSRLIKTIYSDIFNNNPDLIWTIDDKPFSSMLGIKLSKTFRTYMTIHDLAFHPSFNQSFRNKLYIQIWEKYRKAYMKKATGLITMSKNVYSRIQETEKMFAKKTLCLQLGAHVPDADERKPKDLTESIKTRTYNLFFGRIDKYKGLDILLESYALYDGEKKLVIAGSGEMNKGWLETIEKKENITLVNRYIDDGEMIWLIKNANSVILPYVEASQSGVIPIAYSFNVPVITSNVYGLTQNVENYKTGIICKDINDYINAYNLMDDLETRSKMIKHIDQYFADNFDWIENIKKLIGKIESSQDDKEK